MVLQTFLINLWIELLKVKLNQIRNGVMRTINYSNWMTIACLLTEVVSTNELQAIYHSRQYQLFYNQQNILAEIKRIKRQVIKNNLLKAANSLHNICKNNCQIRFLKTQIYLNIFRFTKIYGLKCPFELALTSIYFVKSQEIMQ